MQLAVHTQDVAPPMVITYQSACAKQTITHEGEAGIHCYLVIQGVLCRSMSAPNGKRQIVGFHMAGDVCGNVASATDPLDYSIEALSDVTFAPIRTRSLSELIKGSRLLGCALRRHINVDAAISRQWILNLGQRPAYQRLAHLICEIEARARAAGVVQDGTFKWYGTQSDLGAAVGLSVVHTNKTLSRLKSDGLAEWGGGVVRIDDLARLRKIAGFDPGYLRLDQQSLGSLLLSRGGSYEVVRGDGSISRSETCAGIGSQARAQSGERLGFGQAIG